MVQFANILVFPFASSFHISFTATLFTPAYLLHLPDGTRLGIIRWLLRSQ